MFVVFNKWFHFVKDWFNQLQKKYSFIGFLLAVIRKHSADNGGYQSTLITYYGFLSLLPLLIVATSLLEIVLNGSKQLSFKITHAITQYFPIVGSTLNQNIHDISKAGFALVIGLIVTLWGTRGISNALQHALDHIWNVPVGERPNTLKTLYKNFQIILLGGSGFLIAAILSGLATSLNHGFVFRVSLSVVSIIILFVSIYAIQIFGSSLKYRPNKSFIISALVATIGLEILQIFGGYIVNHELHNLRNLYGAFALFLGLIYWLSLQSQVLVYSFEIGCVYGKKLWPTVTDSRERVTK